MLNRHESPDGCPAAADPLLIVTRQHLQSLRTAASSTYTTVTANLNQSLHISTKPFTKAHVLMSHFTNSHPEAVDPLSYIQYN